MSLGAAVLAAPSSAVSAGPARGAPVAASARTMPLNLTVKMHLVGRPGHVLTEQGSVAGTFAGSAYSRNIALLSNKGESTFTLYAKGGTLSGRSTSHGHVVGATAYFTGTVTITSGTGTWAHATDSQLQFSGTFDRQNYNVIDHVTGTLNY
jgi:hypothetical protein